MVKFLVAHRDAGSLELALVEIVPARDAGQIDIGPGVLAEAQVQLGGGSVPAHLRGQAHLGLDLELREEPVDDLSVEVQEPAMGAGVELLEEGQIRRGEAGPSVVLAPERQVLSPPSLTIAVRD